MQNGAVTGGKLEQHTVKAAVRRDGSGDVSTFVLGGAVTYHRSELAAALKHACSARCVLPSCVPTS